MATRPDARRALRAELAWGAAAVAVTMVLAALALHLWDADLRVPFSYTADANQNQLIVKGMLDHGWYQTNPSLGAPFEMKLYDFPVVSGDNLQMVLMKLIGVFTSDSALVINLFFLLTFALSAVTAYVATRLLGLAQPASAFVAVLFALLPYHFLHGERHLFIAAYYAVPLSAFFVVAVLQGRPLIVRDWRRLALLALAVLVIGSAHVYYAAFAIALLFVAGLVRVVIGAPRSALTAVWLIVAIGVVVGFNHLPNVAYRAQHGKNTALERQPSESESYGLKIAAMVLPVPDHRLGPLAHLRSRYDADSNQLQEGPPQALGTIAAVGLVGLLLVALSVLAIPARRTRASPLLLPLAGATVAAILIGTVGGFSSVFAYVFTPQLRAWGRISVFVGFFALVAVALAAEAIRTRRGERPALVVLALLLVVGFLDQVNSGSVPAYASIKREYQSDAALVRQMERTLGPGASVFELPYEPFPEPQPAWQPAMGPYDMGRGYVHSQGLRWSYGLMKGRSGNWQAAVMQLPPELLARAVVAAGFTGIYLDRDGYADRGAAVLAGLERETHAPVTASADTRLAFVDLRRYAQRLRGRAGPAALARLRAAVLEPARFEFTDGFFPLQQDMGGRDYPLGTRGTVLFRNPGATKRRIDLAWTLVPAVAAPASVVVTWPDGLRQTLALPPGGKRVERQLLLAPGQSAASLEVTGRAQIQAPAIVQPYYLRVLDPVLVDSAFAPFGPIPRDRHAASWLEPFGAI